MRTWQSGTKRCELAVEVEASSWYHYIPPDGRLYLPFLYELGGWEPRAGRRIALSHASDEGRFAGGEVWQGASTRGFSRRIDELFPFRLGELADQRVTKVTGRVWRRKIFQDAPEESDT